MTQFLSAKQHLKIRKKTLRTNEIYQLFSIAKIQTAKNHVNKCGAG